MSVSKEKLMHISNALELLQNTLKCVICLEMLREPVSTRCGHNFCSLCLNNLLNHKKRGRVTCPLCSAVINRRGVIQNDKIKRHVDGVIRVLKAVETDTAMDITKLRQNPSSTFEANSPVAGPSTTRNRICIEVIASDNSDSAKIEDSTTPKRSPPQKLSSAEKVKTWLIQNDNDFESKAILNDFSNPRKTPACDDDSENEMISVSQVVPTTNSNAVPVKEHNDSVRGAGKPVVRRSLKIKEINQLTSGNIAKSADDAFDRLLQDNWKVDSPKSKEKSTVTKDIENSAQKNKTSLTSVKSKSLSKESRPSKSPELEMKEPRVLSSSQTSKNDAPHPLQDNDIVENFPPDEEMPLLEPMLTVTNTAQQSKKTSSSASQVTFSPRMDSCEIIPASECGGIVPIIKSKCTQKKSDVKETKKETPKSLNAEKQIAITTTSNQEVTSQLSKRHSSAGGNKALQVSRCAVFKGHNVAFFQLGRVVRERRLVPVDIRCYCVDKPMFLLDLDDSSPQPTRVPSSSKKLQEVSVRELQSVVSQTSPVKPSCELAVEDDNAIGIAKKTPDSDTASEDMFPISPEKIVQSGGVITKRRSNNSSIVSDGILDAATVVFTQPPIARSLNFHDMDNTLLEPGKPGLKSPSESLLSKENVEAEPSGKSDSDEELVGIRKSSKRPRRLSSSDDSEYGEEKIRRPKKKKKSPLSDSGRNMIEFMQEELPVPPSLFDQTLESPQRLVQGIKAKIAAGMLNTTDEVPRRTSPRASPRVPRISRQASKLTEIDLTTSQTKKPCSDSDISDCELLEGTPQQQTSINTSRRSLKSAEGSFSGKALNTTVTHTESCTPGFVEATQPPFDDQAPNFDPKKSESKISGKTNLGEDVRESAASPGSKRKTAEKSSTPQRPLREKNTTEERASNKTLNNISTSSTKEDRLQRASNKTLNNISTSSTKEDRLQEKRKDATPRRTLQIQASKFQTPKKLDYKLCFVCSGLAGNFTGLVQKLAALVGADFSSKFDAKATHLIVRTKEDNTTDKTLKYLCAVAAKKWVVSFQWVVEGLKQGKLLPEEKFEVLDTTGAEGPRMSRLSSKLLFSGFEFCIFPPLSDITKQQLEELVQMCGASVVSDPKEFSFAPQVLPLCLAEYDEEREQEYAGWIDRYCVPLVQHEWILDCIGRFSLVSFWGLLMSDVSDDNLRAMGYPPHLIEHATSDSTEME